jgi:hypothetical protein
MERAVPSRGPQSNRESKMKRDRITPDESCKTNANRPLGLPFTANATMVIKEQDHVVLSERNLQMTYDLRNAEKTLPARGAKERRE